MATSKPKVLVFQKKTGGGGYTNVNVSCVINLSQALLTEEERTTFSGRDCLCNKTVSGG